MTELSDDDLFASAPRGVLRGQPREMSDDDLFGAAQPSGAGRALGLGVRDVISGVVDTVRNPAAAVLNIPLVTANRIAGREILPEFGYDAGQTWADALGLPRPGNAQERVTSAVGQGAAGMVPFFGGARIAQGVQRALPGRPAPGAPVTPGAAITDTLANQPGLDAFAGAAGGLAQGLTVEAGGGDLAGFGANLAGGLLGGAVGAAVLAAVARRRATRAGTAESLPPDPASVTADEIADAFTDPDVQRVAEANGIGPDDPRLAPLAERLRARREVETDPMAAARQRVERGDPRLREPGPLGAGNPEANRAGAEFYDRALRATEGDPGALPPARPTLGTILVGEGGGVPFDPQGMLTTEARGTTQGVLNAGRVREETRAQAEDAFRSAEAQRGRVQEGVRDTQAAGRPEGVAPDRVTLHDGFPVRVLEEDGEGNVRAQRYDPRTGEVEPDSVPYTTRASQLRAANYAQQPRMAQDFTARSGSPRNPELPRMAGPGRPQREPRQTFRATPPDPNQDFPGATRPGPEGRSPLPEQPDGPGPFRPYSTAEEAERVFQQRRAQAEEEARRARAEQPRYESAEATNTPGARDADGRWPVDGMGYVVSDRGGPIRFGDQKQAARWILSRGQRDSPDQFFDIAVHPSGRGFTVKERGRNAGSQDRPRPESGPGQAADPPPGAGAREDGVRGALPAPGQAPRGPDPVAADPPQLTPPSTETVDNRPQMSDVAANQADNGRQAVREPYDPQTRMPETDAEVRAFVLEAVRRDDAPALQSLMQDAEPGSLAARLADQALDMLGTRAAGPRPLPAARAPRPAEPEAPAAPNTSQRGGADAEEGQGQGRPRVLTPEAPPSNRPPSGRENMSDEELFGPATGTVQHSAFVQRFAEAENQIPRAEREAIRRIARVRLDQRWEAGRGDRPLYFDDLAERIEVALGAPRGAFERFADDLWGADPPPPSPPPTRRQTPAQQGKAARDQAVRDLRAAADRTDGGAGLAADKYAEQNANGNTAAVARGAFLAGAREQSAGTARAVESSAAARRDLFSRLFQNRMTLWENIQFPTSRQRTKQAALEEAARDAYRAGVEFARSNPGTGEPINLSLRTARGRETRVTGASADTARTMAQNVERMPGIAFYANPLDPALLNRMLLQPTFRAVRGLRNALLSSAAARKVGDTTRFFLAANRAVLRTIEGRYPNVPEIKQMADMLATDPGGRRQVGETFQAAADATGTSYINRLGNLIGRDRDAKADARIRDILTGTGRAANPTEAARAASTRKLLDEFHDYLRKAGVDLGYVRGRYFPRLYDSQKILENQAAFERDATRLYQRMGLSAADARRAAEDWTNRIAGVGRGRAEFGHTPMSDATKGRALPADADTILHEWLVTDPREVLSGYFINGARHAEFVRRFGKNGEKAEEMFTAMFRQGVPDRDIQWLRRAYESSTGTLANRTSPTVQWATGWINTLGPLALLPRAVVSSLVEGATIGSRTGSPWTGLQAVGESYKALFNSQDTRQARQAAELLGIVSDGLVDMRLAATYDAATDTKLQQRLVGGMFRTTGLHQFTMGQRVAATKIGQVFVRQMVDEIAQNAPTRRSAEMLMRELGMDAAQAAQLSRWLKQNNGTPSPTALLSDAPEAQMYRTAIRRFVAESIQNAEAVDKPALAQAPVGRLAYGITSFMFAFTRNVLLRSIKMTAEAVAPGDLTLADRMRLLGPLTGLMTLAAMQAAVSAGREAVFNWHAQEERDAMTKAALTVDRTGLFGNFSPIINLITAAKYDRDPSSVMTGPYLAHFATNLGRMTLGMVPQPVGPNSPNTNNAEHAFVRSFHAAVLAPALSAALALAPGGPALQAVYGIGTMYGTSRGVGTEIADALVGERTVRRGAGGEPANPFMAGAARGGSVQANPFMAR